MIVFFIVLIILFIIFFLLINHKNINQYIERNKIQVYPFSIFEEGCKTGDLIMTTNTHPISKLICDVCEVPFSHVLLVIKEQDNVGFFEVNQGTKVRLVSFSEAVASSDVNILGWKRLIGNVSTSNFLRVMGKTRDKEYQGKLWSYSVSPFLKKEWVNRIQGKNSYWCTSLIIEALVEAGIIEEERSKYWYSLNHFFHGKFKFKEGYGYEETCFVRY
jgi:hypothetical protein